MINQRVNGGDSSKSSIDMYIKRCYCLTHSPNGQHLLSFNQDFLVKLPFPKNSHFGIFLPFPESEVYCFRRYFLIFIGKAAYLLDF